MSFYVAEQQDRWKTSIVRRASFTTGTSAFNLSGATPMIPETRMAGCAGSAHSALSIFRSCAGGDNTLQDEIASSRERSVVVPRLPCALEMPHTTLKWSCVRPATADADHRAGYVNTDNCVTRTLLSPSFPAPFAAVIVHHVCGQGRNPSYIQFRSVATCHL